MPYIEFNHIVKEYGSGEASIKALDDASFYVEKGFRLFISWAIANGKNVLLLPWKSIVLIILWRPGCCWCGRNPA